MESWHPRDLEMLEFKLSSLFYTYNCFYNQSTKNKYTFRLFSFKRNIRNAADINMMAALVLVVHSKSLEWRHLIATHRQSLELISGIRHVMRWGASCVDAPFDTLETQQTHDTRGINAAVNFKNSHGARDDPRSICSLCAWVA